MSSLSIFPSLFFFPSLKHHSWDFRDGVLWFGIQSIDTVDPSIYEQSILPSRDIPILRKLAQFVTLFSPFSCSYNLLLFPMLHTHQSEMSPASYPFALWTRIVSQIRFMVDWTKTSLKKYIWLSSGPTLNDDLKLKYIYKI